MKYSVTISLAFSLLVGSLTAEDVIPTAFTPDRYTAVWETSPFNREVVKVVAQAITSNFAQTLTLEGIVTDDTIGSIAYVRDAVANQPLVITSVKSASHPYTIVSANLATNPEKTRVTITDGKETGEIGYVIAKLNETIQQFKPQAADKTDRKGNNPKAKASEPLDALSALRKKSDRVPGNDNPVKPEDAATPQSATPALDRMDEPRRRKIPLPGQP